MTDTLTLLTTCVLPGCPYPVALAGDVCEECLAVFGPMLQETDRPPLTAEQIEARDRGTADMYRLMAHVAAKMEAEAEAAAAAGVLALEDLPEPEPVDTRERKRNQTCWLCEERRTCTRTDSGWECDTCIEVRG